MKNNITHNGVVEAIENSTVSVRIVQSSACSGCKIASHCTTAESKVKVVEVATDRASDYKVGDAVEVIASDAVGRLAVTYGFAIPLLVMIVAAASSHLRGYSDVVTGISCLSSIAAYYAVLYLIKGYFKKVIIFSIRPIN